MSITCFKLREEIHTQGCTRHLSTVYVSSRTRDEVQFSSAYSVWRLLAENDHHVSRFSLPCPTKVGKHDYLRTSKIFKRAMESALFQDGSLSCHHCHHCHFRGSRRLRGAAPCRSSGSCEFCGKALGTCYIALIRRGFLHDFTPYSILFTPCYCMNLLVPNLIKGPNTRLPVRHWTTDS